MLRRWDRKLRRGPGVGRGSSMKGQREGGIPGFVPRRWERKLGAGTGMEQAQAEGYRPFIKGEVRGRGQRRGWGFGAWYLTGRQGVECSAGRAGHRVV